MTHTAKVGDAIFVGKPLRRWLAVREEPYTRKDGIESKILTWQTNCRACGDPFEVTTGAHFAELPHKFDLVNCPAHRGASRP